MQKLLKAAKDNGLDMASMTVEGVTATVAKNDGRWQVTVSGKGELDDTMFSKAKDPVYTAYYDDCRQLMSELLRMTGNDRNMLGAETNDYKAENGNWRMTVGHEEIFRRVRLQSMGHHDGMVVEFAYDLHRADGAEIVARALGYEVEEGRIK